VRTGPDENFFSFFIFENWVSSIKEPKLNSQVSS
jgi:hypothetical protein